MKRLRFYTQILVQNSFLGLNFWRHLLWQEYKLIKNLGWYFRDYVRLTNEKSNNGTFPISRLFPQLFDKEDSGGTVSGHYFHQDLHVARLIHEAKPNKHIDIGSRIDGFVAHVASFREIEVFDIRAIENTIDNIVFRQADIMSPTKEMCEIADSISCLHVIEHFGLGRYADPVDFVGYRKGIEALTNMLKPGGTLYFSTPIGPQRIEFNAHRVFSMETLLTGFEGDFDIADFAYIDDQGNLIKDIDLTKDDGYKDNFNCQYGCGIFVLKKKINS